VKDALPVIDRQRITEAERYDPGHVWAKTRAAFLFAGVFFPAACLYREDPGRLDADENAEWIPWTHPAHPTGEGIFDISAFASPRQP
jgi:hypothetical protein